VELARDRLKSDSVLNWGAFLPEWKVNCGGHFMAKESVAYNRRYPAYDNETAISRMRFASAVRKRWE
jgi:hypothetical protein